MAVQHAGRPDPVPDAPPPRETAVAKVMTSTSVGKHPTAFNAAGLPRLRIALDVAHMTPVLEPLLAPLTSNGRPPALTYARLLAYKAGNRGTVRYDVDGGAAEMVLGKLYPEQGQVDRVNAILSSLWGEVFQDAADLGVPRPLGVVPELSMLVYVPVTGRLLDELLVDGSAAAQIQQTARWLAALHGSHLDLDRQLKLETEIVNLHAWAVLVARAHPEHGDAAGRLAASLASRVDVVRAGRTSPIHKDFHYRHVLVDDGVGVIDLDEVRLGDPMYDVAHFAAHLRLLACRNPAAADAIAQAEEEFLTAYADLTGEPLGDSYPWFATYTCVKIAKQLCSLRGVRPHPDGEELVEQLTVMLDQGAAFYDLLR